MKAAFIKVLLYYSIMGILSLLAYLFIPHGYIHAPGVHHLLILLMFGASFFWGLIAFFLWLAEKDNQRMKFYAIFNLIPSGVFILWMIFTIVTY